MFSVRSFLVLCVAVSATSIQPDNIFSRGTFVVPNPASRNQIIVDDPSQQFVFLIGSQLSLTWQTNYPSYTCYLVQYNLTQGLALVESPDASPDANQVYYNGINDPLVGQSSWDVSTEHFDLDDSPVFSINCSDGVDSSEGFESYFFNLTDDPSDPRLPITTGVVTRLIASNALLVSNASIPTVDQAQAISNGSQQCAPQQCAPQQCVPQPEPSSSGSGEKVGLGVGIGLGLPIIGLLSFLIFRTYQQKNQERDDRTVVNEEDVAGRYVDSTYDQYTQQEVRQLDGKQVPAELDATVK